MVRFRNLRAEEIEVRPTDTKYKGKATLLLYKDARTDRRILDESVGAENWQCEYYAVNGITFCRVGIKTQEGEWVWKSDCGSESNIEADKGLSSDCFKRACFRWGIGVELYSIPRIKITCPDKYYLDDRMTMTFSVKRFKAEGEDILDLLIVDRFGNKVYEYKADEEEEELDYAEEEAPKKKGAVRYTEAKKDYAGALRDFCVELKDDGEKEHWIRSFYGFYKEKIKEGFEPKSMKALWKKWKENPARKEDDKVAARAAALSDNE